MKIAELEAYHEAHIESSRGIRAMVERREFPAVFSSCVESFPCIVPAFQFRKKRDISPAMPEWTAFDVICRYAPPLFEHEAIESLWAFVKSTRVLSQHERGFLDAIESAHKREELAHTLWNHIEKRPGTLQRDLGTELGVTQEDAVTVVELWEGLGILGRQPEARSYRLHFHTQLDADTVGVCPTCGAGVKKPRDCLFQAAP